MTFKSVQYESGHEMRDHGANDYTLHCPNTGEVGTMHASLAVRIEGCRCGSCGFPIGAQVSPPA